MLKVIEVLRALDCFLFKVTCGACGEISLVGIELFKCPSCETVWGAGFDLEHAGKRNLTCVPDEKRRRRKGLGKRTVQTLMNIQAGQCAYCSRDLFQFEMHIDHIIPSCIGGTNNLNNLVLTCSRCNLIASSKVFKDFDAKRAYVLSKLIN
jgi:5-methylcytosine-specific restriction endonuclease McrA